MASRQNHEPHKAQKLTELLGNLERKIFLLSSNEAIEDSGAEEQMI